MNSHPGFGSHLKSKEPRTLRAVKEVIQNFVDQLRVVAGVENDGSIQLTVTESSTGYEFSYSGEWLGRATFTEGCVVLINAKTQLPAHAFQHGGSGKRETATSAGFFGDGLKLACSFLVAEGVPFLFYSGSELVTFEYRDTCPGGATSLFRVCTPMRESSSDLVFCALVDEAQCVKEDFLLFCQQGSLSSITASDGFGWIAKGPASSSGLYFHGVRIWKGNFTGDLEGCIVNVNMPTTEVVKMLGLTRDRQLTLQQVQHVVNFVTCKCLVDDNEYFERMAERSYGVQLRECVKKGSATFVFPRDDFWSNLNLRHQSQDAELLAEKLYKFVHSKLGNRYGVFSSEEEDNSCAALVGPRTVVVFKNFPICWWGLKAPACVKMADVLKEYVATLRSVPHHVPAGCTESDIECIRKSVNRFVPEVTEYRFVTMGTPETQCHPVIRVEKTLFVDLVRLLDFHEWSCVALDASKCACKFSALLRGAVRDILDHRNEDVEQLVSSTLASLMQNEQGEKFACLSHKLKGHQEGREPGDRVSPQKGREKEGVKSVATQGRGTTKPVQGKDGDGKRKAGGSKTSSTSLGGLKKPRRVKVLGVPGDSADVIARLKDAIQFTSKQGGLRTTNSFLSSRSTPAAIDDCDEGCIVIPDLVQVLVGDRSIWVPAAHHKVLPEFCNSTNLQSFLEVVEECKRVVASKVIRLPPINVFFEPTRPVSGFLRDREVYLNLAYYVKGGNFSELKYWFSTLLHELSHLLETRHNGDFANVFSALMMQFVKL